MSKWVCNRRPILFRLEKLLLLHLLLVLGIDVTIGTGLLLVSQDLLGLRANRVLLLSMEQTLSKLVEHLSSFELISTILMSMLTTTWHNAIHLLHSELLLLRSSIRWLLSRFLGGLWCFSLLHHLALCIWLPGSLLLVRHLVWIELIVLTREEL